MKRRKLSSFVELFTKKHKTFIKAIQALSWLGILILSWVVYAPAVAELFGLEILMTRVWVMLIIISFSLIVEYS